MRLHFFGKRIETLCIDRQFFDFANGIQLDFCRSVADHFEQVEQWFQLRNLWFTVGVFRIKRLSHTTRQRHAELQFIGFDGHVGGGLRTFGDIELPFFGGRDSRFDVHAVEREGLIDVDRYIVDMTVAGFVCGEEDDLFFCGRDRCHEQANKCC